MLFACRAFCGAPDGPEKQTRRRPAVIRLKQWAGKPGGWALRTHLIEEKEKRLWNGTRAARPCRAGTSATNR